MKVMQESFQLFHDIIITCIFFPGVSSFISNEVFLQSYKQISAYVLHK